MVWYMLRKEYAAVAGKTMRAAMKATIRPIEEKDCAAVLAIYAPYVEKTAVSFELDVPSQDEFLTRIRLTKAAFPYLVCEAEGEIAGYAYAHSISERLAYQWSVELSVYVKDSYHGKGVSHALYEQLIRLLRLQGVKTLYVRICVPNEKSVRFHAKQGFETSYYQEKTGYKLGQWRDVLCMQKVIGPYEVPPVPVRPFPQAAKDLPGGTGLPFGFELID